MKSVTLFLFGEYFSLHIEDGQNSIKFQNKITLAHIHNKKYREHMQKNMRGVYKSLRTNH